MRLNSKHPFILFISLAKKSSVLLCQLFLTRLSYQSTVFTCTLRMHMDKKIYISVIITLVNSPTGTHFSKNYTLHKNLLHKIFITKTKYTQMRQTPSISNHRKMQPSISFTLWTLGWNQPIPKPKTKIPDFTKFKFWAWISYSRGPKDNVTAKTEVYS